MKIGVAELKTPAVGLQADTRARKGLGLAACALRASTGRQDPAYARHYGSLNAISSPGKFAPLMASTMYCLPFSMYVIGDPDCGAGM